MNTCHRLAQEKSKDASKNAVALQECIDRLVVTDPSFARIFAQLEAEKAAETK